MTNVEYDFFRACKDNDIDTAKACVNAKSIDNVNIQDKDGWTALMWASLHGHIRIAELLIDNGADINIQDRKNYTALIWTTVRGHTKIAQFLLDNGANINLKNNQENTALITAIGNEKLKMVKLLIENNIEVTKNDIEKALLIIKNRYLGNIKKQEGEKIIEILTETMLNQQVRKMNSEDTVFSM